MEKTEQLYKAGQPICPTTNYENENAEKRLKQAEELLVQITATIANELLRKGDISAWAKQAQKPTYTASEVGADQSGSAARALADAKEYSDSTYIQATGYTDLAIAELIGGAPSTRDTLKKIADAMAENEDVVQALEAAIGNKANETEYQAHAGNKTVHVTASEKAKIQEIDAIKQSFQDGCSTIAGKLTTLGVTTAANASPETIADNIQQVHDLCYAAGSEASKVGTATADKVLTGYSFTNSDGVGIDGTMPVIQSFGVGLRCGASHTIPKGFHDGTSKVIANDLASQTQASASAANITKDKTAYINGVRVTGTGADNTAHYNAGVAAADARVNTASANYQGGYNAGVAAADGRVNTNSQSYIQGYAAGLAAGAASAHKTLQVRGKGHESGGVQYFYARIYDGDSLVFDQGGWIGKDNNTSGPKDAAGYVTINSFTV